MTDCNEPLINLNPEPAPLAGMQQATPQQMQDAVIRQMQFGGAAEMQRAMMGMFGGQQSHQCPFCGGYF